MPLKATPAQFSAEAPIQPGRSEPADAPEALVWQYRQVGHRLEINPIYKKLVFGEIYRSTAANKDSKGFVLIKFITKTNLAP